MKKILFENIVVEDDKIGIDLKTEDDAAIDEELFFEFSNKVTLTDDILAVALCTLCGQKYDYIYMDLDISEDVFQTIVDYTNSVLEVNNVLFKKCAKNEGNELALLFSGGLDSLSVYSLLKNQNIMPLNIMSLDFGGVFAREELFFRYFVPHTIRTNFVSLKLNRNSSTFMYVPAILLSKTLNIKYNIIGDIFEAENHLCKRGDDCMLRPLDISSIPLILGLTEVGTAMVSAYYSPELISFSLKSLAAFGGNKYLRKQFFVDIISEKYGIDLVYERMDGSNSVPFGKFFWIDFYSFYLVKNKGFEEASKLIENMPESIIDISNELSLNFYERFNPLYLDEIPESLRPIFLERLAMASVYPYDANDFYEIDLIFKELKRHHKDVVIDIFDEGRYEKCRKLFESNIVFGSED
ncbi:MAG: hypothetical protein BZ135_05585 [Methanosphaera sp. rholeuAM6]|nr:MAG: hypothetical protein BZ135_05585 [Methanosphaera sp. rholeuAM6]